MEQKIEIDQKQSPNDIRPIDLMSNAHRSIYQIHQSQITETLIAKEMAKTINNKNRIWYIKLSMKLPFQLNLNQAIDLIFNY